MILKVVEVKVVEKEKKRCWSIKMLIEEENDKDNKIYFDNKN